MEEGVLWSLVLATVFGGALLSAIGLLLRQNRRRRSDIIQSAAGTLLRYTELPGAVDGMPAGERRTRAERILAAIEHALDFQVPPAGPTLGRWD